MRTQQQNLKLKSPGRTSMWSALVIMLVIASMVAVPSAVHGGDGTPPADVPPVQVEAEPTVPPQLPTAVPTLPPPPPTAVPPTAVPTAVPPTAMPTVVPPTEVPVSDATIAPTEPVLEPTESSVEPTEAVVDQTSTPSPTESPETFVNTDSLSTADGVRTFSIAPGDSATMSVVYAVTTPRSSTSIVVRMEGAGPGWSLATSLPDLDPEPFSVNIKDVSALAPGDTIVIPLTVSAPRSMAASGQARLHVWSTADATSGNEDGVIDDGIEEFVIEAVAPVATDTIAARIQPLQDISLASGESLDVTVDYVVTTPRESTKLRMELQDDSGSAIDGWSLAVSGSDSATSQDTTALEAGTTFAVTYTVTAPDDVDVPHDARMVVWSEAATLTGPVAVLDQHQVLTIPVTATPAEPTIDCLAGELNEFTCDVNPDRADVTSAMLHIEGKPGWTFSIDGVLVETSGEISLDSLDLDPTSSASFTVQASYPTGCAEPETDHSATLTVEYAYEYVDDVIKEISIPVQANSGDPDVSITSATFQDMPILESRQSLGTIVVDVSDLPTTCGWELTVDVSEFTSEMATVPSDYLRLIDVAGIEGASTSMSNGQINVTMSQGQEQLTTATLTITTLMTFPVELPPGDYHTSVTVQATRLQ